MQLDLFEVISYVSNALYYYIDYANIKINRLILQFERNLKGPYLLLFEFGKIQRWTQELPTHLNNWKIDGC